MSATHDAVCLAAQRLGEAEYKRGYVKGHEEGCVDARTVDAPRRRDERNEAAIIGCAAGVVLTLAGALLVTVIRDAFVSVRDMLD